MRTRPIAHASLKTALRTLLDDGRLEQIADMALRRRRVLGSLIALTYDPDRLIGWRAIDAMGLAAASVADDDPAYVREHLRRLYWLITEESGGICWRAPEAMAEIVRRLPTLYPDYIPIVVTLLMELAEEDLDHFRPGVLWAIGRLGTLAGDEVPSVLPAIEAALDHAEPQVRGMAVWCLMEVDRADVLMERSELFLDQGSVERYERRQITHTSVGELARHALRTEREGTA